MRVSTNEIFRVGIDAMQRGQSQLSHTQLQLSSGKRILTPADDPRGATQALQLRERIDATDQFLRNSNFATSRLNQEETVLGQMGGALQRARELTVQAANATQTTESRQAIAAEIRHIVDALVDLGNTRDANGEYLFAGFKSGSLPFVSNAAGEIEYLGDNGQRFVAISTDRQVAVGDSGDKLMSVPRGNGVYVAAPSVLNTGSVWITATEVTDPTTIGPDSFTIQFTTPTDYDILDASAAVIASGTYADGQAIDIGGRRIVLSGTPSTGDSIAVDPAGVDSMFAMLTDLATAIEQPAYDDATRSQLSQATGFALQNLDQSLGRVIELRTAVGARLNTIESQGIVSEEHKLQLQTTLSSVEDLDYAEAISRLSVQQAALEAAQQTYVQLSRLSLFDFIR